MYQNNKTEMNRKGSISKINLSNAAVSTSVKL